MSVNLRKYLFYYLIFSIAGFIWEVLVNLVTLNRIVNPGMTYGPWLPIYGWMVLVLVLLPEKIKKHPLKLFAVAFVLVGILEFGTSLFLEYFYQTKWWDYSNYYFNYNGRVCLEALFVFAALSIIIVRHVFPLLNNLFNKIDGRLFRIILITVLLIFIIDYGYSLFNPHELEIIKQFTR